MSEDILYDVADGIGTITFNRPQARNAFTFAMYERVAEICDTVPTDGSVRVLIMTGAGDRAFAAGTDISQFRAFQTPEDALKYEARIDDVITRIERCAVPTIAAVAGACTGGGASYCFGLRSARRHALCQVRLPGRAHARQLPVFAQLRPARLALFGPTAVKELVFTARLLDAEEGRARGLYSEVVEDHPTLHRPRA